MKLLSASFSPESIRVPAQLVEHKRILISGAGGSIGSALAHAIADRNPERVLLLDSSEQSLFRVDREIQGRHVPILANVCDVSALDEVFERHRPHIVFHAAAFKQVPLMELHPLAAVQNNTIGTFHFVQAAVHSGVEQIILVSTDKAVDPTSVMGVSKRLAELVALALRTPTTKIKAVRLVNVYASQGSVVPLFKEQIAARKPITITHREATRYFLTMEQAIALLIFALSEEFPSAVLVPEVSNRIRIEEIVRDLMQQSGSKSPIIYAGLRPGEKLHERLLSATESLMDEGSFPLRAVRGEEIPAAEAAVLVEKLQDAVRERNLNQLLWVIGRFIPAYTPSDAVLAQRALTECRA